MGSLTTTKPTLKIVDDAQAADRLRELIKDADDGFRRVVKAGLYIEWIAANLKHGQLLPWIEAHAPEVTVRTIHNWRSLAKNLCEWGGLKLESLSNLAVSGDRLLECPLSELPAKLRPAREKMDEALGQTKSAKQLFLFLGFKQGEIASSGYAKAKIGRAKGEGGASREQRAAHKARLHELDIAGRKAFIVNLGEAADEAANRKGIGDPECSAEFEEAFPKIENLFRFMQSVRESRK